MDGKGSEPSDEPSGLGETQMDPNSDPHTGGDGVSQGLAEDLGGALPGPTSVDAEERASSDSDPERTTVDGILEKTAVDDLGDEAEANFSYQLPADLAQRLEIVGELKRGSQAVPLVVRERGSGEERILKIFDGIPEEEYELTLAMIAGSPSEHLVRVFDFGTAGNRFWEELEYCREGSLADLIARSPGSMESPQITQIVSEISSALAHLHSLSAPDGSGQMIHRDVKPANILVRDTEPYNLVLCDFGLSRVIDSTLVMGSRSGTDLYAAPEVWAGAIGAPRDWWALGMIVVELATGRHPFRLAEGAEMNRNEVQYAMTTRPIDVSGVKDERVRLLASGLLTRDDTNRWGAREVAEWLEGGSPKVHEHEGMVDPSHREEVIPFLFSDPESGELVEYSDPIALAGAMGRNWARAAAILHGDSEHRRDNQALTDFLGSIPLDPSRRKMADEQFVGSYGEINRRLYILLRVLAPSLTPVYRTRQVDAQGLADLAFAAVNGDEPSRDIVWTLFNDAPLKYERRFGDDGNEEAVRTERDWELAWRQAQPKLNSLISDLTSDQIDQEARDNALLTGLAMALLVSADDGYRQTLNEKLEVGIGTEASAVPAWYSIAERALTRQ